MVYLPYNACKISSLRQCNPVTSICCFNSP